MFDTMTLTKIVGAFCGTFLIYLLGAWAAEAIYHVGGDHGEDHQQAYAIEVEEEGGGEGDGGGEEVAFADVFAEADPSAGESVFRQCQSCHNAEQEQNQVGPHLVGVVGRAVGAIDGFNYSGALSEQAEEWTPENLNAFLEDPQGWAPGTNMSYSGLSDVEDRANLIAWLDQTGS